jgi:hypothetical protein
MGEVIREVPHMPKLRGCRVCFIDLQAIALADGGVVLLCAACDAMADERHHAGGARPWPAGMARKPMKLVISRPKTARAGSPGRKLAG